MMVFEAIMVFFFGACIGSFLNVCIHRLPMDKSIIGPRSFCPKCKRSIKWYDNIPLVSFVILLGKCRYCKEKISLRYPLVELITAVLFLALYINFGISVYSIQVAFLFSMLVLVSFIDIDYHAIPVYLCVMGIIAGFGFHLAQTISIFRAQGYIDFFRSPVFYSARGILFGLGFVYFFKLFGDVFINIYLALRKKDSIEGEKESMGLGDVDFMGMIGAFLGVRAVLGIFFLAPFIAVIYSIIALVFKKSHLIPYLPYLSLATIIWFFWGNQIIQLII
jgi:leader peptidase (prepilin peptidase) / N-methyltransferase